MLNPSSAAQVGAIRSFGNVLAYVTDFAGHWCVASRCRGRGTRLIGGEGRALRILNLRRPASCRSAPGDENDRPNGMWGNRVIFAPNTSAVYHDCSAWMAQVRPPPAARGLLPLY